MFTGPFTQLTMCHSPYIHACYHPAARLVAAQLALIIQKPLCSSHPTNHNTIITICTSHAPIHNHNTSPFHQCGASSPTPSQKKNKKKTHHQTSPNLRHDPSYQLTKPTICHYPTFSSSPCPAMVTPN